MDKLDSIGHYRIGEKLGSGGMGEVYRATDTRLGRDVAIKRITPELARDAVRMASLTREAQVLASLNHPNIASIYGIEDEAIVMELVEGPTLAERLEQGPVPLEEALGIARQIADALVTAHDKGIVHRDLKPANIKLTPDGTVKLLDFGLAKAAAAANVSSEEAVTIAMSMASSGLIVGTPGYMAPEQARGLPVDKRVDIWAFGVVLYEMLTGTTLFRGDTITDVMAAVVREEPDLSRVPARVRPLLRRCLEKEPRKRLRDIADAAVLLETAAETGPPVPSMPGRRAASWLPWAVAAALAIVLVGFVIMRLREAPAERDIIRFKITLPAGVTLAQFSPFAIAPDGRTLVFPAVGNDGTARLWLQPLDALEPRPLPGSETVANPQVLSWSTDASSILFNDAQGTLKRIEIDGGPPETVVRIEGNVLGGVLSPDGSVLYGSLTGIMRVPPGGGAAVPVVNTAEPSLILDLLPDNRHFLYSLSARAGDRAVFVGDAEGSPDQQNMPLVLSDYGAIYAPAPDTSAGGYLLFPRAGTLMAQPFDADTRELSGSPRPIAENVFGISNQVGFGGAFYSASLQGTLVYRTGTIAERLSRQLAWFARDGRLEETFDEIGRFNQVKISPDGTRVVTSRTELETGSNADLWITDLTSETSSRFTFGGGANVQPIWAPDGRSIAWVRSTKGSPAILRKASDGSGEEEELYRYPDGGIFNVADWTADGRFIIYSRAQDVFALPIGPATNASRQPIPLVQSPANEFAGAVSPDMRWLTYMSNETGRQELYVQPFTPGGKGTGGKWLISRGSSGMARWRSDSRELTYVSADGAMMSVDVEPTPGFRYSAATSLFQLPRPFLLQAPTPGALADATRDLKRFLLAVPSEESARQEITVVLNWDRELN